MQPPLAGGQGIKNFLKKKKRQWIWNAAGIRFLVTFSLSTSHCHRQSSSVWSGLCHSWQPAVPRGEGQQGPWPWSILRKWASPRAGTNTRIRAERGEEESNPNFTTIFSLWHLPWIMHSTLLIHILSPRPKQGLHSDKKAILFHSCLIAYSK